VGTNLLDELATDYNPVTHRRMTPHEFGANPTRLPYTLVSTTTAAEGAETTSASCDGACGDACDVGCNSCCPCWTFLAEAIWLQRDQPTNFGLTFPGSNDPSILNTNDLDYRFMPGYRLTVLKSCCCDSAWEASYFAIDNWSESASVTNPNRGLDSFLRVGIPNIPNFRNAFRQTITGGTDLYSFELNKRRTLNTGGPWEATILGGFRYFYLSDNLQFLSNDVDPAIDPTDIGLYTTKTRNNLVGAQIGGVLTRWVGDTLNINFKLKAGLFANFTEQNSHLMNQQPLLPPNVDLYSSANKTSLATVIETGVYGNWAFANNWGLRGGYDVFIFSGLALAPSQLDFTANQFQGQPFINADDTLVAHGPTIGVWHTW
jgi:hypothetical protein